jgi:hypothetical protein
MRHFGSPSAAHVAGQQTVDVESVPSMGIDDPLGMTMTADAFRRDVLAHDIAGGLFPKR